jgi:hypothetical protein
VPEGGVSVVLQRAGQGFLFRFACAAGCKRPAILAPSMPDGWEYLRATDGQLLHRCPGCRFDEIVARFGWTEAA